MKAIAITLLVIIGLSFSFAEIVPVFPGYQPLIIDGSTPITSNSSSTGTEIKTVIDGFNFNEPTLLIEVPAGGAPPTITLTQFTQSSLILGGERDVVLTVLTSTEGKTLSASVSDGTFSVSAPNALTGIAEIQYDGVDGLSTINLSPGLGSIDLTKDGSYGFQVSAVSDITTSFSITVYSGKINTTVSQSVTGSAGREYFQYQVPFSSFTGIDFTQVLAIKIDIQAAASVDFVLDQFATYGGSSVVNQGSNSVSGTVLPCNANYYRLQTITSLNVGDYIRIHFNQSGETSHPTDLGSFYIVGSNYPNLQVELESNLNIIDTLGELPGPTNYLYACENVAACDIEITCQLEALTYYIAVVGGNQGYVNYNFLVNLRQAEVFELFNCTPQVVINDRRATQPPTDRTLFYRFFAIEVPSDSFVQGSFLVVNISRAQPYPLELRLSYGGLPGSFANTGVWDVQDYDSAGDLVDDCTFGYCVDTTNSPYYYPVNSDQRFSCVAQTTSQYLFPNGPQQLTAKLVVDPCQFKAGTWYASVLLPVRNNVTYALDNSGNVNYTITACIVQPTITPLEQNVTFKGYVEPELQTHYSINVTEDNYIEGATHLLIQVSNIRNGYVDIWVHSAVDGALQNLAGGPEGCLPANATCHACDACNIVIEKCHFTPGVWYISLSVGVDASGNFEVVDYDRLPITYTIRANWLEDPVPTPLLSGIPVTSAIGAALYDFYVVDIPATIDTWLFIELFTNAYDTEVNIAVLHGSLPGGECYDRPDFYCATGAPQDVSYTTPLYGKQVAQIPPSRESCTFMIQTCELEAGPLYISVYGQHTNSPAYGDNTYYQIPVHYTLYVDFDVATALQSSISITDTVYEKQYKHYYIRADQILEGSYMAVEVTNIQHGIPQTVEVFVMYNYLAGDNPCYDNLYNATGAQLPGCNNVVPANTPNYVPQPGTVAWCATILVPACDFRPGVWYVSVLGVNEDLVQHTTPIGYTLTVTVFDAPVFHPLILGQSTHGTVAQWNETYEYTHFKLAANPVPLTDLVVKITYVQNCEYQGKHDNLYDILTLFVNSEGPAGDKCYDYYCQADIQTFSYCTIVIPNCEWQTNTYFIAVRGDYDSYFPGRFTIRASLEETRFYQLTSGVSVYDRVFESRYKHYFITSSGDVTKYLAVDFYTNQDQDLVNVYLNLDSPAGAAPCYNNQQSCLAKNTCSFQIEACNIAAGRYYISVSGIPHQFYDISVEYTLTASLKPLTTVLGDGNPLTGSVKAGQFAHFQIQVDQVSSGDFLQFEIDNVQHGSVAVYYQYGSVAGRCPCYIYEQSCYADAANTDWCEIRIAACDFAPGKHFFSVAGLTSEIPTTLSCSTAIGFTIEASIVKPNIIVPTFVLGRNTDYIELYQFVANGRYNHYEVSFTQQDYDSGYHIIVEITSVRDGALFVYFTPDFPGDESSDCHLAQLCTSGLGAGSTCYWQIPFSITKPRVNSTTDYITIQGITGRLQASYNILIYKQAVPSIIPNPTFTLDNQTSSAAFAAGTELNVTHYATNEPNGWTQFVQLTKVPAPSDPQAGELLEVFFYRIVNNYQQPMAFNVYLYPNYPAGAHECCDPQDSNLGSCQGAPTLRTASLTTQVGATGSEVLSYTCNLPAGVNGGASNQPFFGQRCTVRVWPCEYNKYECTSTSTWWLAVVPVAPTETSSPLNGLSYSVQFRTRDIRLDQNYFVNSISLLPYVNTYNYTPNYYVRSYTTEDEGWLSFVLDFTSAPFSGRLSIQTQFVNGTSVVYINSGSFTTPPEDVCADYYCASNDATMNCNSQGRFLATTCNLQTKYYITVRNIGAPQTISTVNFRIIAIHDKTPVSIPAHVFQASPFVTYSTLSSYSNIYGVQGESYDFYTLTVDDGDISIHNSLIIDFNRNNLTDTGSLNLYFRYGARAGEYNGINQAFYTGAEGCYGWDYACSNIGVLQRCILQIPHTQLLRGFWSISVYNPNFDFINPVALPKYSLSVYLQYAPQQLYLGVPYVQTNATATTVLPGTYTHFQVNVTESDIEFLSTTYQNSYYTNFLRFQLTGLSTNGQIQMYINYDDLAGVTTTLYPSLQYIGSESCTPAGCIFDILPCALDQNSFKLKTGTYYVALLVNTASVYNLTVAVHNDSYTHLGAATVSGTGDRVGLTDYVWSATPSGFQRSQNGDGFGYYRYALNTSESGITDLTFYYFYANITIAPSNNTGTDYASVEIWRDDCARWVCQTSLNSYCIIDALTLAPCSAHGGIYYIRVYAPTASLFTVSFHQTEILVQTLLNNQIFADEIYPYQYDEYFFASSADVHQGATLAVQICAICGEIEAWIRADLPAGPSPDASGYAGSCAVDHCAVSSNGNEYFENSNNCCTLFLDSCEYEQRGYYIGVRGVGTTFPNGVNQHLYLPAKYEIQATQTNIQVTDITFCTTTLEYTQSVSQVPQQFAVDLESANVGANLRFTMLLPTQYVQASGTASTLQVSQNRTVGYTTECANLPYTCSVTAGSGVYSCSFIIPSCSAVSGRYYIWADAPRGTEILVERWDPYIPLIHTDITYSATINAPNNGPVFDLPFRPSTQYYRFDYPFPAPYSDTINGKNIYEKFFIRIRIENVLHGSLSAILNTGYAPYNPLDPNCEEPLFVNTESCLIATDGYDCYIDVQLSDLAYSASNPYPQIPSTFWLTIIGDQQLCALHSIQYSFVVQTSWEVTYFNLDTTICESVALGEYNFHRLRPHAVEYPQQTYLLFTIADLNGVGGDEVELLILDNYLPTLDTATVSYRSGRDPSGDLTLVWFGAYENLYFSIYGIHQATAGAAISYRINVTKVEVPVVELFNNYVFYADDDNDEACPHVNDVYYFRAIAPNGGYKTSFLRVAVESESYVEVYVNKEGFAWSASYVAYGALATGTLNLYDFCEYEDTIYYITVNSNGPYKIYTNVVDTAITLTLGSVHRHSLTAGQYQLYTLEICADYIAPDDRLVVEITDISGGNVYGWIQRDSTPGPYQTNKGTGFCDIAGSSALALFGDDESGYDFLLVDHCDLDAGIYYILIRADPNNDPRNLLPVSYRLFPYLKSYGVHIQTLAPNTVVPGVVDFYTVDRISPSAVQFINYYQVTPLYYNYQTGISFAQVRLSNVQGGLLRLRAQLAHLATPQYAYIPHNRTGLTQDYVLPGNLQSGNRRNTYQPILDPRHSAINTDCDGCSDFCFTMTVNEVEQYLTDSSAALFIPSCYWDLGYNFYVAVETVSQFYEDISVSYDIEVDQYADFTLLQPNTPLVGIATNDNWEYNFYRSIQADVESARWRVVVTAGEGVLVTVRNNRCPLQATWTREIWCDAASYDRPWLCDIEIPTAAAHPGNNVFFITTYAKNVTYSILYFRGLQNCFDLTGAGYANGLNFCSGLVPYATWSWDDFSKLDSEAQCFFEDLYDHFAVQPAWRGVTSDCNSTLQQFACYESFRRCDQYGFQVGTCRKACEAVVYECVNWFESVHLEHYNCTSSRYIDEGAYTCTGSDFFQTFTPGTANLFFPLDPVLLFDIPQSNNAQILSLSFFVSLVVLLLL